MVRRLLLPLVLLLIAACSSETADVAEPEDNKLLESQRQAMDKAREVDAVLQDAAARERKAIDEQSR